MTILRRSFLAKYAGIVLLSLGATLSPSLAQKTQQELPVVTAGVMPLYPRLALVVHIEGVVKIKVTTDGERVASLDTESGPPMLVEAAKKSIQTWEFEKHKPTSFITTFRYRIEEPAQCGFSNGTAVLHVPAEVEVSSNGVQTCDPAVSVKPKGHAGS